MEYGLDINGNLIHHYDAKYYEKYRCPDCLEPVIIRTGANACFCNTPIHDRTPHQRTCPEYHENNALYNTDDDLDKKIDNDLDKLYIRNGGVPVYLCCENDRFELRAYFPTVSESIVSKLREVNAKIYVNTNAEDNSDKATYSIESLNFYKITTIQPWINIHCEPDVDSQEIIKKWLWGIMGVDINRDIYHSNKDGGYRLALKANVYVGKTYRILSYRYAPSAVGIKFTQIGHISLKKSYTTFIYDVYQMEIYSFTEEARRFIEGKGYRLLEKADELLPLWPPAVFAGNELTFSKTDALFLHINSSNKESVYYTNSDGLTEISNNQGVSIVQIPINNSKTIAVSEKKANINNFIGNPGIVRQQGT